MKHIKGIKIAAAVALLYSKCAVSMLATQLCNWIVSLAFNAEDPLQINYLNLKPLKEK